MATYRDRISKCSPHCLVYGCREPMAFKGFCTGHMNDPDHYDTRMGDPFFGGLGILTCFICSKPYIEHDIALCPEALS